MWYLCNIKMKRKENVGDNDDYLEFGYVMVKMEKLLCKLKLIIKFGNY